MSEQDPVALEDFDERYARLRIVHPGAERAMRASLERLGQLMPLIACERGAALAIVDGFKRLSAARKLGMASLRVSIMPLAESAALAAVLHLNRAARGLSDLEEALVVRALCRDIGLEQVQIAELCGRHKSWVSRRLSLVERLDETIVDDVKVGLVTATVARELARLPRGNQTLLAAAIQSHALGSRDAARLVTLFLKTPGAAEQRYLLDRPREALDAHTTRLPWAAHDPRLGALTQTLHQRLFGAMRTMSDLSARLSECTPASWTESERQVLTPVVVRAAGVASLLTDRLGEAAKALKESDAA